jgi:hypothetical protein
VRKKLGKMVGKLLLRSKKEASDRMHFFWVENSLLLMPKRTTAIAGTHKESPVVDVDRNVQVN